MSIPIFTTQLEKSRETTDIANMRSAYAIGTAALLDGSYATTSEDGTVVAAENWTKGSDSYTTWYDIYEGDISNTGTAAGQGTAAEGGMGGTKVAGQEYSDENHVGQGIKITVDPTNQTCTVEFADIS